MSLLSAARAARFLGETGVLVCDYTERMPARAKTSRVRRPGRPAPRPPEPAKIAPPWRLRRVADLEILELAPFQRLPWLVHGFSTRAGGQSQAGDRRVLNLGFTEWDSQPVVLGNRLAFQSAIDAQRLRLVTLEQFHSAVVRCLDAAPDEPCRGDAAVTGARGLLLGVETADCVPILLVDPKKRVVAAVHAGWRGTLSRIAEKAVGQMRMQFGSRPDDLLAALGPAIGGCCYQVGAELVAKFASQFRDAHQWFDEPRTGEEPNPLQWLNMMPPGHQPPPTNVRLDLRKANRAQLLSAGLAESGVFASDLCTACQTGLLFSYRREGNCSGRLLAAVGLREG
jgi:YfiH family protein